MKRQLESGTSKECLKWFVPTLKWFRFEPIGVEDFGIRSVMVLDSANQCTAFEQSFHFILYLCPVQINNGPT